MDEIKEMTEYTWHDLIQKLEDLEKMLQDGIWVSPLNPNLSEVEQRRIAYYIEHPEGFDIFDEMNKEVKE